MRRSRLTPALSGGTSEARTVRCSALFGDLKPFSSRLVKQLATADHELRSGHGWIPSSADHTLARLTQSIEMKVGVLEVESD